MAVLTIAISVLRGPRKKYETSTNDKLKGSFHEVKGAIKEEIGKVTNNRDLKAEGKTEKKAGIVQQQMGQAKEAVVKLRAKLADLKS